MLPSLELCAQHRSRSQEAEASEPPRLLVDHERDRRVRADAEPLGVEPFEEREPPLGAHDLGEAVERAIVQHAAARRVNRLRPICSWTLTTSIGLVHAAAAALEMPASASWVPSEPVAAAVDFGFDIFALPRHNGREEEDSRGESLWWV